MQKRCPGPGLRGEDREAGTILSVQTEDSRMGLRQWFVLVEYNQSPGGAEPSLLGKGQTVTLANIGKS